MLNFKANSTVLKSISAFIFPLVITGFFFFLRQPSLPEPEVLPAALFSQTPPKMTKGININPWFRKPHLEGQWQRNTTRGWGFKYPALPQYDDNSFKQELQRLKEAGFDFLRVPIHPGPLLEFNEEQAESYLNNISVALDSAFRMGFNIVINLHTGSSQYDTYERISSTKSMRRLYESRLLMTTRILAGKYPDQAVIEIFNEPVNDCSDHKWPRMQETLVNSIEENLPGHWLMVTGNCYSGIRGLDALNIKKLVEITPKLIVTFHFYEPFLFTHQGSGWSGNDLVGALSGLIWPPIGQSGKDVPDEEINRLISGLKNSSKDDAFKQLKDYFYNDYNTPYISNRMKDVSNWAAAWGLPQNRINLGEFGVLKKEGKWKGADLTSAANWIKEVQQSARAQNFSWAMWSYGEGMALLVDGIGPDWYPEITDALELKYRPPVTQSGTANVSG